MNGGVIVHNQEKYIHKINDNKYRIKFLKVNKEKNRTIKFDQ